MGGIGSGHHGGRPVTTDRRRLDVRLLQRLGLLVPGSVIGAKPRGSQQELPPLQLRVESDDITLTFRRRNDKGDHWTKECHIRLERTPCNYGGSRVWFLCPSGCGRRVALLYFGEHGQLACRHCGDLRYRSQRETRRDRTFRHANKLRKQLGWPPGVAHGHGGKPKGMHWATYRRLRDAHDHYAAMALVGLAGNLDALEFKVARLAGSMNLC